MKYLVLFDIDGTILKFKHSIAKKIFAEELEKILNLKIPEKALPDFHGMTDLQIIKNICFNIGYSYNELSKNLSSLWENLYNIFLNYSNNDNIYILPGIRELIEILNKDNDFILGLLTGNFKKNAYLKIRTVGLEEYFQLGAFGCDTEDRNLLPPIAIERANKFINKENLFNNSNTIIIGDTFRDIQCAKVNNIACISVCTGYQSYEELIKLNPEAIFNDLSNTFLIKDTIIRLINEKNYYSN